MSDCRKTMKRMVMRTIIGEEKLQAAKKKARIKVDRRCRCQRMMTTVVAAAAAAWTATMMDKIADVAVAVVAAEPCRSMTSVLRGR